LNASLTNGKNHIIIAKSEGKAVHFNERDVRPMGGTATGVRAVTLESENDKVIGMVCINREDANLLVVSEKDTVKGRY
jgi:DNA gyrase subunit A